MGKGMRRKKRRGVAKGGEGMLLHLNVQIEPLGISV